MDCGRVDSNSKYSWNNFIVEKFSNIFEIIIPFFKKYPIYGVKKKDFADFCEVAELMKAGKHLTPKGLEEIKKIKARMNKTRRVENN